MTQRYKNFLIKTTEKITKLIHSHNKMDVYFSSIDMEELNDNSEEHIYYLSLIVNNKNEMCAKVSRVVQMKSIIQTRDEQDNSYEQEFTQEFLEIFDCDITLEYEDFKEESFIDKVDSIRKEFNSKKLKPFPTIKSIQGKDKIVGNTYAYTFDPSETYVFGSITTDDVEDFTLYLLALGENIPAHWDTDDLINAYQKKKINSNELAEKLVQNYKSLYEDFFCHIKERNKEGAFVAVLESVIDELSTFLHSSEIEAFKEDNEYKNIIIERLKEYLNLTNNL